MHVAATLVLLVICELCLTIRVPVTWDESASEVKQEIKNDNDEQFSVDSFKPQNINHQDSANVNKHKNIPILDEYFQYTAKKPQFAVDVSKFYGVQSPENYYKAYPIKPYNGKVRPELGKHHLFDQNNVIYKPLQEFANLNEDVSHAVPVSSNYEVFHPYEAETPALQEIYKDPTLTKIRNDLENSKNRLQNYEKDGGELDIQKDEYLESPEKTDNRFFPHRNVPAPYEIHRPQRRPVYYRPVVKNHHPEQHLNQRLRHPWNQYSAKIRPIHYRPIKNHIHQLRQNHALKYDDDRNEYPQVHILENYSSDPKDGYDIYEKGKEKFVQLRNNVDESINNAVKENQQAAYQRLEMQNENHTNHYDNSEEEFVPIKNYAQVRKTETYKHLPKSAALADAESFDEIRNAPRLREAVKSTKAQTVYSEEGYEDSAYDHAGEQKHASENEDHGGYLKEHELSGGKYKTPSISANNEDQGDLTYRDQVVHAEKWNDDNTANKSEYDTEDYSEDEEEKLLEVKRNENSVSEDTNHRNKRENDVKNNTATDISFQINNTIRTSEGLNQSAHFEIPELDLNSTFLSEQELLKLGTLREGPKKDDVKQKYPYYFKNFKEINKNSPLRYAENLKFIPHKSKGGTEFYDSRTKFECPEVDDAPNPIPEKLNRNGHPDDIDYEDEEKSSTRDDKSFDTIKKSPRLAGLGDKIDCFKAKYFGEDPLDSPFFKEEIITNPEPVVLPNLASYKLKSSFNNEQSKAKSQYARSLDHFNNLENVKKSDILDFIDKLRNDSFIQSDLSISSSDEKNNTHKTGNDNIKQQSRVTSDVYNNTNNNLTTSPDIDINIINSLINTTSNPSKAKIYSFYKNQEDITQLPDNIRKKRSTSFIYEPYKIIREGQIQDSKKTTTPSNISPLIRQLQSSRVVDRVPIFNQDIYHLDKHVKRNVNTRTYKEIDRKDRKIGRSKNDKVTIDPNFVDVSVDYRRGEPRYEIRHSNHKSRYSPVENKKSMSLDEYKIQTNVDKIKTSKGETSSLTQSRQITPNVKLKSEREFQNVAESSNTVQKSISSSTIKPNQQYVQNLENNQKSSKNDSDEDLEEYDYHEEEEIITTTTRKPSFRRKNRLTTTSERVPVSTEKTKLKLVTRFRNNSPSQSSETEISQLEKSASQSNNYEKQRQNQEFSDETNPKYREKKKKTSKSTLVTDMKRYGDENGDDDYDDNMEKDAVDAMIGVDHDMDHYLPLYELEQENKSRKKTHSKFIKSSDADKEDENENLNDKSKDVKVNHRNKEENNDDYDDNDNEDYDRINENDDHDDDEDEELEEEDDNEEEVNDEELELTTQEPMSRTLAITTDAPVPTSATQKNRQEIKPIVTRKRIEIHKELPVNKSSPHVSQFKQDIKEVEIIKEMPAVHKRKPHKNLEALELYKDDDLAKDVNKLGGVEIFKEGIDFKKGPRHGGNYRSLDDAKSSAPLKEEKITIKSAKEDTEASQSEYTKHIELENGRPNNKMHGGNLKSLSDPHKIKNRARSSKLIELNDAPSTSMHGGNLKKRGRGSNSERSQKLLELDDDHDNQDEYDPSSDHESFSNSENSGPMHGGNYRSAKITQEKPDVTDQPISSRAKGTRRNSAAILNSFVQVAPILTTTPAYILDPSKRMYYYVDA